MNTYKIKQDAKEFAFNNKGVVWRALCVIYLIGLVGGLITGVFNVIDPSAGDLVNSLVSVLSLIITPVVMATFVTYITKLMRGEPAIYEEELGKHKPNWTKYLITSFMVELFTTLWTLLFIIPGIVKAISYSQTIYLQAEHPDWDWKKCIEESKRVMEGHKMEYFGLVLSFIGWCILSIITCGIALIWLIPYLEVTLLKYHNALCGVNEAVVNDNAINMNVNSNVNDHFYCPHCGTANRVGSVYCQSCGSKLN